MRVRLPANPVTYLLFGALWVGLTGWGAGGARRQTEERVNAAKAFAGAKEQVEGWVWFTYDDPDGGYNVGYRYRLPSGQVYEGGYPSKQRVASGVPLQVAYAVADPMVSRAVGWDSSGFDTFPIEWFAVGMGLLGFVLIGKFGMDQADASRGVRLLFLFLAPSLFVAGALYGLSQTREMYTLQIGDEAWSSPSFDGESNLPSPPVRLSSEGLWVGEHSYGSVPNRSHVWVRGEEVLVNGVVTPRL